MKDKIKKQSITFGELKKMRIEVSKKWFDNMILRYAGKDKIVINLKDLINAILAKK